MRGDLKCSREKYDAVVIGSGPNGLAAAITIAQTKRSVLVIEGQPTIGGGARTAELTIPGFQHDVCSAVHPLGIASPFFSSLPLHNHGLEWIQPPLPLAHPLDDGTAVVVERSVEATAANLGIDGKKYARLMQSLVTGGDTFLSFLDGPFQAARHPLVAARFGWRGIRSASSFARSAFQGTRARAMFAGHAAHSILPLNKMPSAGFGLVLAMLAHHSGWPLARGGSASITAALASYLQSLGGEIVAGVNVESVEQLPPSGLVLADLTPRQLLRIAGLNLPEGFRRKLQDYRYGPGVCKVDWAVDAPIPWTAEACTRAGTVHLGGTLEEIEASEKAPWQNLHSDHPFVLLTQPSLFDDSRAPAGKHIAWAYCHVPNRSRVDMSEKIENQVERFAPGFRGRILKRSVMLSADLELHNPNLIGGDVGAGAAVLSQLLFRPTRHWYKTPAKGVYLCSAATPPGAGVHGLCGHLAARTALRSIKS
jgi:phytoene dehydrogenase-like protein